jgi:hypothetical protein
MESSGTYGDTLRQALSDNGIEIQRAGGKAAHDCAEVFDGVPSQHDGKDAAVVAELAALGKGRPWPYETPDSWDEELTYWVENMVIQRQLVTFRQGRLEGLVARHWPEAFQVLKLSSGTLLHMLKRYSSPQALAADPETPKQLAQCVARCSRRRRPISYWPAHAREWVCAWAPGNSVRSRSTPSRHWPLGGSLNCLSVRGQSFVSKAPETVCKTERRRYDHTSRWSVSRVSNPRRGGRGSHSKSLHLEAKVRRRGTHRPVGI